MKRISNNRIAEEIQGQCVQGRKNKWGKKNLNIGNQL